MASLGDATGGGAILDHLVVGAGIGGLYTAWRLLDDPRRPSVAVVECDSRVGGRLLTVVPPGLPNARVELGGMRYLPAVQRHVSALVKHFGLTIEDHTPGRPENLAYLRGARLTTGELDDREKLPYGLKDKLTFGEAMAASAYRFLGPIAEEVLGRRIGSAAKLLALPDEDKRKISREGTYRGMPLRDVPLRYAVMRTLGAERLALIEDATGYDSLLYTWSAADGYWWNLADFGPGVSYVHIRKGFEQLPREIAKRLRKGGVPIETSTELVSYSVSRSIVTAHLQTPDGATTVRARNLVLALPRRSLERIDGFAKSHRDLIEAVRPVPLFKLAICYPRAWWQHGSRGRPITGGRSTTDLPIRQCWYWATDTESDASVIMVYDDGSDLDYWSELRGKHQTRKRGSRWSDYPAPGVMVDEVHRQLVELHGFALADVPKPTACAYRDWGDLPIGGGAHFWRVGYDSYDVADAMLQPDPKKPVWVCGEAYSHAQGWVEGALETSEAVLDRLGCPARSW